MVEGSRNLNHPVFYNTGQIQPLVLGMAVAWSNNEERCPDLFLEVTMNIRNQRHIINTVILSIPIFITDSQTSYQTNKLTSIWFY